MIDQDFEDFLAISEQWARVQIVQSALSELENTQHSGVQKATQLRGLVVQRSWNRVFLEELVNLTWEVIKEKREIERLFAGRTAQRAGKTLTNASLGGLIYAVISYCDWSGQAVPSGTSELLSGQSFPGPSTNKRKRLMAALIGAAFPDLKIVRWAKLADVGASAIHDWKKEKSFSDLMSLMRLDSDLLVKAIKQFQ